MNQLTELVTIRTYDFLSDAHLDRMLLEASDIPAFVQGQFGHRHNYPLRLQVRAGDLEAAKKILASVNASHRFIKLEPGFDVCPVCLSQNIERLHRYHQRYRILTPLSFLIEAFFSTKPPTARYLDCEARWNRNTITKNSILKNNG